MSKCFTRLAPRVNFMRQKLYLAEFLLTLIETFQCVLGWKYVSSQVDRKQTLNFVSWKWPQSSTPSVETATNLNLAALGADLLLLALGRKNFFKSRVATLDEVLEQTKMSLSIAELEPCPSSMNKTWRVQILGQQHRPNYVHRTHLVES